MLLNYKVNLLMRLMVCVKNTCIEVPNMISNLNICSMNILRPHKIARQQIRDLYALVTSENCRYLVLITLITLQIIERYKHISRNVSRDISSLKEVHLMSFLRSKLVYHALRCLYWRNINCSFEMAIALAILNNFSF